MYIILMYDIEIEGCGSTVLRKVFKTAKKHLFHIQNSVFEGEITESELLALTTELKQSLRAVDSCIIFKSRSKKWLDKEFLAKTEDNTSNFL